MCKTDPMPWAINLAGSQDERFGGKLAHVVVMQHVDRAAIDRLIRALEQDPAL